MDQQGMRLGASQIIIRNSLRFADSLPLFYLVGGIACVMSRHAQRLGDFAAGTVVVRNPRHREPDLDQILGGRFNSLAEHPHLAARLKQRVTPQEASVALRALLRIRLRRLTALDLSLPATTLDESRQESYIQCVFQIQFAKNLAPGSRSAIPGDGGAGPGGTWLSRSYYMGGIFDVGPEKQISIA